MVRKATFKISESQARDAEDTATFLLFPLDLFVHKGFRTT